MATGAALIAAEVDEDERIDRERDAFCDDCADEHHPDLEGGLYS